MVAWTSSSGITVQAYRTDMVAEALAVRRWRRRRWRGWGGVPGEGLQGLLSGQGSTALRGPDPLGCGRPCDPAGRVPEVQGVLLDGASDQVHRQSALTSCCSAETCTHSANCAEDR